MAHQSFKNEDTRSPTSSTPWTATNQPSMVTPTGQEQHIWTVDDNHQISYHPQNAPTISVVDCCGNVLMTPPANRNVDARNVLPPLLPLIEDALVKEARQAQYNRMMFQPTIAQYSEMMFQPTIALLTTTIGLA